MKIKRLFLNLALVVGTTCSFACCSSDNTPSQENEAQYYVKYEVYMPLGYGGQSSMRKIEYVTEKGKTSFNCSTANWEGTFGPLKKNTKVYINVTAIDGGLKNNIESYVNLSVCRGQEPFALKGSQQGKAISTLSVSYTID